MRSHQVIFALALVVACSASAAAQRSRAVVQSPPAAPSSSPTPVPQPAPATVTAKYEGGYTAYTKKQTGTINFDDAGQRLIFKDKYQREYFSIPYKSLGAIWGDTRAVTSTAAKVVGVVPYGIGLTSLLMPKNKQRFLVLQFDDPDTKINGTTSFKLENKEVLASVIHTLAQKADMKARGDGFIRAAQTTDKQQDKQDE